jgi:uncharacterized membrane protein
MIINEISVNIGRPVGEVFSYLSDLQNGKQWQTGVIDVQRLTPGAPAAGSRYVIVRKFMGRKLESNVEISVFEPNHKMVIRSTTDPIPFEQTVILEPVSGGTRVSTTIDLHPSGWMGMAEGMITSIFKREAETALGDLKDLMEQGMFEMIR